jgi:hypothetical protein
MGRYSRDEIVAAFDHYQTVAFEAGQSGRWDAWADLFTEDAHYIEHLYGEFRGREEIRSWISSTMSVWPNSAFTSFPVEWYTVDEARGWVIAHIWNRLEDPGDGSVFQEYNLSVLHYAGDGRWSFEEDVYNPEKFAVVVGAWLERRKALGNTSRG